jgi:hypothetical protein
MMTHSNKVEIRQGQLPLPFRSVGWNCYGKVLVRWQIVWVWVGEHGIVGSVE